MARKHITDRQVCIACNLFHEGKDDMHPNEILCEMTGQPNKVVMAAMHRALNRKLIDYGTCLETAFLTIKGREFLRSNGVN